MPEGSLLSLSPPDPSLHAAWEALADGLQVQRLALHLPQLREQQRTPAGDVALFALVPPSALTASPAPLTEPMAAQVIDEAGLQQWVRLAADHGNDDANTGPLPASARLVADTLLEGLADPVVRAAVAAVCAASAWWVGAFAAIRHLGVHHTLLRPVDTPVTVEVLQSATGIVALGAAQRILAERVRTGAADEAVRMAYCRAVTESIVVEGRLPGLLDELGELRLVDLVATSIPWRGRFTKYTGGTGAGQVE
ncbi:hypothetical protein [Streptomyces sp. NPDC059819]|uniref:hypothetical protein n=1 Tax=Streptomyces sp. NPDC059819 TaxID=3346963 RepID=UPI00366696DA